MTVSAKDAVFALLLLDDDAAIRLDDDLGATLLVDFERGKRGLASLGVDIVLQTLAWGEHRQLKVKCQGLLHG